MPTQSSRRQDPEWYRWLGDRSWLGVLLCFSVIWGAWFLAATVMPESVWRAIVMFLLTILAILPVTAKLRLDQHRSQQHR